MEHRGLSVEVEEGWEVAAWGVRCDSGDSSSLPLSGSY